MAKVKKGDNESTDRTDGKKLKKKKASRACQSCQKSHLTCSDVRPCVRCVKRGEECLEGAKKLAKYLLDPEEAARLQAQKKIDKANKAKGLPKEASSSFKPDPPAPSFFPSLHYPLDSSSSATTSTRPSAPPNLHHQSSSSISAVSTSFAPNDQSSAGVIRQQPFPTHSNHQQHQPPFFPSPSSAYPSNGHQADLTGWDLDPDQRSRPPMFPNQSSSYAQSVHPPLTSVDAADSGKGKEQSSSSSELEEDGVSDTDGSEEEGGSAENGAQLNIYQHPVPSVDYSTQHNDLDALSLLIPPSAPAVFPDPSSAPSHQQSSALGQQYPVIASHLHPPPQQQQQHQHQHQHYSSLQPQLQPYVPPTNNAHATSDIRDLHRDRESPAGWGLQPQQQQNRPSAQPQLNGSSLVNPLSSLTSHHHQQQQTPRPLPSPHPTQPRRTSSLVDGNATIVGTGKTDVVGTLMGGGKFEEMFKAMDLPQERKNGNGYRRLIQYFHERYGEISALQILKILSELRPKMLSLTATHTLTDTTLIEATFHRTLHHLQQTLFPFTGTPTAIWRRTGEIVAVSPEFSILTEWSPSSLIFVNENGGVEEKSWRGRYVWEILERQSVIEYFEMFAGRAFDECRGGIGTGGEEARGSGGSWQSCVTLLAPDVRPINCCAVFSVKRDMFDLPLMIIGQFLPFL